MRSWWSPVVPLRLAFGFEDEWRMLQGVTVMDQDKTVSGLAHPVIDPQARRNDLEPEW